MLVKSQVKYIQSLGHKKFRESEAAFVAEGPKIVGELIHSPAIRHIHLYALQEWIDEHLSSIRIPVALNVTVIKPSELERISFLTTPNLVLGIFRKPVFPDREIDTTVSLALDDIQDPGNLGTIVRIADWFGISQVVCSEDTVDVFNPKVVQSTMGSIGRVQVSYTSLRKFFSGHPGITVYGTTLEGESVLTIGQSRKGIILIGNESKGIRKDLYPYIHHLVSIPRRGEAESLNAAVAAGIVVSHLVLPASQGS